MNPGSPPAGWKQEAGAVCALGGSIIGMRTPVFFNAHHAPIGAFASFTLGFKGAKGGLGIELKGPADEPIFIGVEDDGSTGHYRALPFFDLGNGGLDESEDYDVEGLSELKHREKISYFDDSDISREFGASVDTWRAGDLTFRIISRVASVPDPATAGDDELKEALTPAVIAELTLDNRRGTRPRKAFFGYAGSNRIHAMRTWKVDGLTGIAQGTSTAIACADESVYAGIAWQPEVILEPKHEENLNFLLGSIGMLVGTVPAGESRTFRFAVAFFREGTATTGISTRYLYRRWFDTVEQVASYALTSADRLIAASGVADRNLQGRLSPARTLMAAHTVRSYYGATQCLELEDGTPLWIVNEGEYRMMNTFDLTVDQLFFELAINPWTVRSELDLYADRYSYEDRVRFPGEDGTYPGGIAFTHDVGISNCFARAGYSGYEQSGLNGCFSYMCSEELVNWALCACLYVRHTGDLEWADGRKKLFVEILNSMLNRDHPVATMRNGVMGLDGARCEGGKEITTYDSLDASLGQARNNTYLAVKSWAAYVLLGSLFGDLKLEGFPQIAHQQASLCAKTVSESAGEDGLLPAIIGEGVEARIIPAIEGLVYPLSVGRQDLYAVGGPYADLCGTLQKHFAAVLKPGVCLFPDGGWKLSSTSRNSWLSKIYLCQFVAERVFGCAPDTAADQAHLDWLMDERNSYFAWSDQMVEGKAVGSRYYPRGVTSLLWLASSGECPIEAISSVFCPQREMSLH